MEIVANDEQCNDLERCCRGRFVGTFVEIDWMPLKVLVRMLVCSK
jgi:hypothetical protein